MNILVTIDLDNEQKKMLEDTSYDDEYIYQVNPDDSTLADTDVIVGTIPVEYIQKTKHLKWLQAGGAGVDQYCVPGILSENVILTNATGAFGLPISEHMICAILMLFRKLHLYARQQTLHRWQPLGAVRSISGTTTLCIGLGDIGTEFCRKMSALGSRTIGIKKRPGSKPEGVDELYYSDKIDELLPCADIVALSLPNTPGVKGLINKERLAKMKKGSIIINVGRGLCIITSDLIEMLENGHLGGAILDVTDPEPLPEDNPLWDMENVIITPHIAGGHFLRETVNTIVRITANNLKAYHEGRPLINVIDRTTGYKI